MERSLLQKARAVKVLFAALLLLMLSAAASSASAQGGGAPGAYLRPPMGAAAVALGGAWSALPENYAAWWNPAVLGFLREKRIAGGSGLRSMGRVDGFGSFEFPIPPRVGMGLLALYRGDPVIKLYGTDERMLPTASYTTMTLKGALSYYVNRKTAVGVCINGMYQSLPTYGGDAGITNVSATGIGALDFAVIYMLSKKATGAFLVKNVGAKMDWQMGDFAPLVSDRPLPVVIAAASYRTVLQSKPLIGFLDCKGYAVDGEWNVFDRPEAVLGMGAEWRRWEIFYVRAGIGDVTLNRYIYGNWGRYRRESSLQITAGFAYDLSKVRRGMWLNYGVATDQVWAGIDQQLDVTLAF